MAFYASLSVEQLTFEADDFRYENKKISSFDKLINCDSDFYPLENNEFDQNTNSSK